jgi:hypothetical protein
MSSAPVSWQELAAVVGVLIALGGVVAGAVCWILTKLHGQALKIAELELSIAERYVTSKAHEAAEGRLVDAIESMRDEFRELVRRIDRYFDWTFDRPHDRTAERKGGAR